MEDFQNADIYNYLKNKKISYIVNGKIIKYKNFDLYSEIKNNNIKKLRKLNNKDSIFNITNSKEYDILLIIETK